MDPTKPKALGPGAELDDTLSVSWRGWMSMPSMSLITGLEVEKEINDDVRACSG